MDFDFPIPQSQISNPQLLGADQQAPAGLIIDLFAPTDFDKAVSKIGDSLENVLDQKKAPLLKRLSLQGQRGQFLTRVLDYSKQTRLILSIDTAEVFKTTFAQKYGYSDDDIDSLISSYIDTLQKGELPATIAQPFDYVQTSISQDVTAGISQTVSSGFNKVLIVGAISLIIYGIGKAYVFKKL